MSSAEGTTPVAPRTDAHAAEGTLAPLLDVAFGFFVWMLHLVAIYVAAALACGLGVVGAGALSPAGLVTALAIATVAAAAIVALHALRRWRGLRDRPERRFRMAVTVGADAIAIVAIVWQLVAIGLVPPCA
jgi:hypothetical protein